MRSDFRVVVEAGVLDRVIRNDRCHCIRGLEMHVTVLPLVLERAEYREDTSCRRGARLVGRNQGEALIGEVAHPPEGVRSRIPGGWMTYHAAVTISRRKDQPGGTVLPKAM